MGNPVMKPQGFDVFDVFSFNDNVYCSQSAPCTTKAIVRQT